MDLLGKELYRKLLVIQELCRQRWDEAIEAILLHGVTIEQEAFLSQ